MREKRILYEAQEARNLVPAWLSPILASVFVLLGQLVGAILLGVVLVPLILTLPASSSQGTNILKGLGSLPIQIADLFLGFELALFVFIAILVCIWVRGIERRLLRTLGFYKERWWQELVKGLGLGLALFTVVLGLLTLMGAYRLERIDFHPYAIGFAILIFPLWLLQGGTEELVIRGWLLPVMAARSNRFIAIAVSSSLFAIMHFSNQGFSWLAFVNLVLFGLLMAFYLLRTDNIWGVAGIHAAWNFAQGNIFGLAVSGQGTGTSLTIFLPQSVPDWLTGGQFGIEASVVTSLVLLVGIAYLAQQLKHEDES